MDETLRIILIIIISVSIFGLLVFVYVKNYGDKLVHSTVLYSRIHNGRENGPGLPGLNGFDWVEKQQVLWRCEPWRRRKNALVSA